MKQTNEPDEVSLLEKEQRKLKTAPKREAAPGAQWWSQKARFRILESSGSQRGAILSHTGHLATSGDIGGATGILVGTAQGGC